MFAVECLMKVMVACEEGEGQYDLIKAKELKQTSEYKGSSCGMHCHVYRILFFWVFFLPPYHLLFFSLQRKTHHRQ